MIDRKIDEVLAPGATGPISRGSLTCTILFAFCCIFAGCSGPDGEDTGSPDAQTDTESMDGASDSEQSDTSETCNSGEWRDYTRETCLDCADATLNCESFDFSDSAIAMSGWNGDTEEFTIFVIPGKTQVTASELQVIVREDTDRISGGTQSSESAMISENTITFDLAGLTAENEVIDIERIEFTDACGQQFNVETFVRLRPGEDKQFQEDCSGPGTGG